MSSAESAFWTGFTTQILVLVFVGIGAVGLWLARKLPPGRLRRFLLTSVWNDKREPRD